MSSPFLATTDDRGVATLTLNRPDRHNAFDETLIAELTSALRRLGDDAGFRAVVLATTGRSFSAGADLDWMRRMATHSFNANLADAADAVLNAIPQGAAGARADAKHLVLLRDGRPVDAALAEETGRRIAPRRVSDEGREGITAFLDKRPPGCAKIERDGHVPQNPHSQPR
ncbi:MAG TPA: enoyl-CoA hydratase-related protein [Rhodopila sp.]